jgi:tetratricopeptide (TPR) repeat protein
MTLDRGSRRRLAPACCVAALLAAALPLAGCQTLGIGADAKETPEAALTEPAQLRVEGLRAIREGRLSDASVLFNAALKLDVKNPGLQFLNGLAYHMLAVQSDRSKFPLAQQGYELAIQFDPTNWIARYHLGLLHLDQRDFAGAKKAFADALLYNDRDPDLLYNMAAAAYYARDPETAEAALTRLREIEPESNRTLRASAIVLAALGNGDEARRFLDRYRAKETDKRIGARVARRVADWTRVHARARQAAFRVPAPPATGQAAAPAQFPGFPGSGPSESSGGAPGGGGAPDSGSAPEAAATGGTDSAAAGDTAAAVDPASRMVIVDVVIISSQEDISTAKGVNILSGLSFQFGKTSDSTPAFSKVTSDAKDNITGVGTSTTTITRTLTLPAINYTLNIANAGATRNEILARPTLVALTGQKSEFFSGENIKAATVSSASATQGAVEVEKDVGVKLGVTPEFLDSGKVKLLIEAERTFLQTPSTSVTYTNQVRTSKTTVSANVVLENGESLILSGLSEKETENIRDGVPGLQELPLVQYIFSRQTTRDFNKSVLVLVTPRIPEYIYRPRGASGDKSGDVVLDELKARYSDWFRPYPNWASVFHHLQNNSLYREFRTGDVALETWNTQTTHQARLKRALEYLYF